MTDHITTEEAERIAEWIDCYHGFGCGCANKAAADALRDLAAERDALAAERLHLASLAKTTRAQAAAPDYDEEAIRECLWALVRAALGENQP